MENVDNSHVKAPCPHCGVLVEAGKFYAGWYNPPKYYVFPCPHCNDNFVLLIDDVKRGLSNATYDKDLV